MNLFPTDCWPSSFGKVTNEGSGRFVGYKEVNLEAAVQTGFWEVFGGTANLAIVSLKVSSRVPTTDKA